MRRQLCDLGWPNVEIDKLLPYVAARIIELGKTWQSWVADHMPPDEDDPLVSAIIEDEKEYIA